MGWAYTHVTGPVNRKAQCDALWRSEVTVLKSAMKGNVYYAALLDSRDGRVYGEVVLTDVTKDYFNFGYKAIGEEMGPCEDRCPADILRLLSDTDNEYALNWRRRCLANIRKERDDQMYLNF